MSDMTAGPIIPVRIFLLGLAALLLADRKDIPAVVRELGQWWH